MLNVKRMLTKISEKLAELNSTTGSVTVALSGVSANMAYSKSGNVVGVNIILGNGTTFSDFSGLADVGTMPTGLRPKQDVYLTGIMRTDGMWAIATYYPCVVTILASSGNIQVRGSSAIANCRHFVCNGCYVI